MVRVTVSTEGMFTTHSQVIQSFFTVDLQSDEQNN